MLRNAFNKCTEKICILSTISTLFLFSVLVLGMAAYPGSNLVSPYDTITNTPFSMAFADSDDEDREDEIEEEIEIEVEIEDGFAKIKVEINDEESKFEIEWIDEQTTIDEIVSLTGLSEDQVSSVITFEIESEDDDEEYEIKQSKKDEKLAKSQEKRDEKQAKSQEKKDEKLAKAQEKRDEKQARNAEKFSEREAKLTEKAQFSQERANKIIEQLEQKIQKMEERLQKLLEKYESGEYYGNIENKDTVTNSFTLSFDGIASEISDSSNIQTLNGQLFLENQVTGDKTKKFRVTGGEISIGEEEIYDIVFGKARLSSSGHGGEKDSMVVIAQASNTGDIRTLKLSINLSEEFDSDTESANIEILSPQSKIASQWFLSGIGNLGLTESEETDTETDTEIDTEIEIPTDDIPISTILAVSTPSTVYFSGDDIIVSGTVSTIHEGTPVILQTVTVSDRVDIAQIDVDSDGTFTHTILADGPLWVSGTYTVKAFYGANNSVETTFEFTAGS